MERQRLNLFRFYDLPIQFNLDSGRLKRMFLLKSKATHPDYFTLASAKEQEEAMNQASINNEAFRVLADVHLRTKHILELHGLLEDESKNKLSPAFLMEMMEINEQLMDAAMDSTARQKVENEVNRQIEALDHTEMPLKRQFDETADEALLEKIKEIYFQRKYLLRIKEKLDTFASR